jgi:hypothetical protein
MLQSASQPYSLDLLLFSFLIIASTTFFFFSQILLVEEFPDAYAMIIMKILAFTTAILPVWCISYMHHQLNTE